MKTAKLNVKTTYSNKLNPNHLVIIKSDNSYAVVGDTDPTSPQLWDMADGLEVAGWNIV